MVFSSIPFIFVFMPVFFGCYYLAPPSARNAVLFLGSMAFYLAGSWSHPEYLLLFLANIVADFTIGWLMQRFPAHRKSLFVAGVLGHVGCLAFFKYATFVCGELDRLLPGIDLSMTIALPVGISFYTFQGLSYLADVYRGSLKAESHLLHYAVYLSMFEQLIAGPIVTYRQVKSRLKRRVVTVRQAADGLGIFIWGLGYKVLLANPLGKLWSQVCAIGFDSISTPLAWMGIAAFSFQLYFDFLGYSRMAVGLGRMLGFRLPNNFAYPYLSRSMTSFWRRWHQTLGNWFRTYVYIPLGGSRCGTGKTIRNLLVVWLLTGLWHGAGYHFILWGLLLFLIITAEKYGFGALLERRPLLGHTYMILMIPLTWAVFAIDDLHQLAVFFTRLFPFFGQGVWSVFRYDYEKYLLMYYPFLLAGILFSTRLPDRLWRRLRVWHMHWPILLAVFGASAWCMYRGLDDPFLYFRF